jgi:hypothetical protein
VAQTSIFFKDVFYKKKLLSYYNEIEKVEKKASLSADHKKKKKKKKKKKRT